jgi:Ca-activated chloride channel family protein
LNLQFQYPTALWALAALPLSGLLYFFYVLWKKKAAQRMGNPKLVYELFKSYSPTKSLVKFLLVLLAFALGCLTLANLRKPDETTGEARKGIDVMVALDVSNSMLAIDVKPNRLTVAKQLILQLMNRLPDDRIGLVLFAGTAYVQMPITFDHNAAENVIATASPSAFRAQGTAIGDALQKCNLSFSEDSKRFKAVVLISDGETHDENALEQAKVLADRGVMINTVGIGSAGGATIIDTISGGVKKDLSGNIVITKLNEQLLQQVATTTNGRYIFLNNTREAANELVLQLGQIEKRALGDVSQFNYHTYYIWLALPMLLLLVAEIFIPDRKKDKA